MRCTILNILLLAVVNISQAQVFTETLSLQWELQPRSLNISDDVVLRYPHFAGATYHEAHPQRPLWVKRIPLSQYSRLTVELVNGVFEPVSPEVNFVAGEITEQLVFEAATLLDHRRPVALVRFSPLRYNNNTGQYEQLLSGQLRITATPMPMPTNAGLRNTTNSVLREGEIYKINVTESGVYKITRSFLESMGINMNGLDPRRIQLFGNGGKMLPEMIDSSRIDDLIENAIWVEGESDGSFDANDYILFYAAGTKQWSYNNSLDLYLPANNIYTDTCSYFIKINGSTGKRISSRSSLSGTAYTTDSYDALRNYEKDQTNLLDKDEYESLPASGRRWFGEPFRLTRSRSFDLTFSNRIAEEPVRIRTLLAARVCSGGGSLTYKANGATIYTSSVPSTTCGIYDSYAKEIVETESFTTSGDNISIGIDFSHPSTAAEAWLDYIILNARCHLVFGGNELAFRDKQTIGKGSATYQMSNANGVTIWDVTDPYNVQLQQTNNSGGNLSFGADASLLREFVAFNGGSFRSPIAKGRVNNQNLHAITTTPNLVIVYHSDFADAALQLATHRRQHSNLTVEAIDQELIFNEFSSGNPDVSAVRDFMKMLYDRETLGNELKYLLLFGDGSYDYKHLDATRDNNTNFVLAYETSQSLEPLSTFTSDDYYGLLDAGDGGITNDNDLDIGVGRLPVTTALEAQQVVQKIMDYDTDPDMLKEWRNRLIFVADDEDSNLHINDADGIAMETWGRDTLYNQEKIYIDAFQQQSSSGLSRYPDANEALLNALYKGALVVNFLGHGSEAGWTQERIFTLDEIETLENYKNLPLFITATCTFAPYDNPDVVSAGEKLLLRPNGGAIGLMTTTRVVYADANEALTNSTFDAIFAPVDTAGTMPTLGDLLRRAKNMTGGQNTPNSRKFALLGDPSMQLAYPKLNVVTTSINGTTVGALVDTLQALERITITGEIHDRNGNLRSDFNGTIYPTVFDKVDTLTTRKNDARSLKRTFIQQNKVIFKGIASVVNGKFSFSFVVPKDINYQLGYGRISYYAENQNIDANGMFRGFLVGGTYANAPADNQGPDVRVYMNDDKFVSGGITDHNPFLFTKLYDENGINTVGNSIGHDLMGIVTLTDANQNEYVLNDFYTAEKDDFTRGTARYPLKNLPDGEYQARVKAWDTYNNMGEGFTDFVVTSDASLALQHVLNYPNPFTTNTAFQFEHNFPNREIQVMVQIFTISGTLIKSIHQTIQTEGYRVDNIEWDGLDEYGDRIGRGVYIYKITVQGSDNNDELQQESEYQKLVILR